MDWEDMDERRIVHWGATAEPSPARLRKTEKCSVADGGRVVALARSACLQTSVERVDETLRQHRVSGDEERVHVGERLERAEVRERHVGSDRDAAGRGQC